MKEKGNVFVRKQNGRKLIKSYAVFPPYKKIYVEVY